MAKCEFDVFDKLENKKDGTPECQNDATRNFLFMKGTKRIVLCEQHFVIVDDPDGD